MSALNLSPFVGWHCSGAWNYVRCEYPCAWCRGEAAKNDAELSAAGLVMVQATELATLRAEVEMLRGVLRVIASEQPWLSSAATVARQALATRTGEDGV